MRFNQLKSFFYYFVDRNEMILWEKRFFAFGEIQEIASLNQRNWHDDLLLLFRGFFGNLFFYGSWKAELLFINHNLVLNIINDLIYISVGRFLCGCMKHRSYCQINLNFIWSHWMTRKDWKAMFKSESINCFIFNFVSPHIWTRISVFNAFDYNLRFKSYLCI